MAFFGHGRRFLGIKVGHGIYPLERKHPLGATGVFLDVAFGLVKHCCRALRLMLFGPESTSFIFNLHCIIS